MSKQLTTHKHKYVIPVAWCYQAYSTTSSPGILIFQPMEKATHKRVIRLRCECGEGIDI